MAKPKPSQKVPPKEKPKGDLVEVIATQDVYYKGYYRVAGEKFRAPAALFQKERKPKGFKPVAEVKLLEVEEDTTEDDEGDDLV